MKWLSKIKIDLLKQRTLGKRSFSNFWLIETQAKSIYDIIIGYQRLIIIELDKFNNEIFISYLIKKILAVNEQDYLIVWFASDDEMIKSFDWFFENSDDDFIVLIG